MLDLVRIHEASAILQSSEIESPSVMYPRDPRFFTFGLLRIAFLAVLGAFSRFCYWVIVTFSLTVTPWSA